MILLLLLFAQTVWAGELPPPPPRPDRAVSDDLYFRRIHKEHNNLVIVTTNPDGSRLGSKGDEILYNNAGSWKDCYNTDGESQWMCAANALAAP